MLGAGLRAASRRSLSILAIAVMGPLVALAAGGYLYLSGGRYVSTDNAYVKADKIAVSADIDGRVVEVFVEADQAVARGKLLFRIDPQPFKIALDRAEEGWAPARRFWLAGAGASVASFVAGFVLMLMTINVQGEAIPASIIGLAFGQADIGGLL